MADTINIPVKDLARWLTEIEEQIEKAEIKDIRDFLEGEAHAYVRILRKHGRGEEYQDFKRNWCDENKVDPVSMRCLMDN